MGGGVIIFYTVLPRELTCTDVCAALERSVQNSQWLWTLCATLERSVQSSQWGGK